MKIENKAIETMGDVKLNIDFLSKASKKDKKRNAEWLAEKCKFFFDSFEEHMNKMDKESDFKIKMIKEHSKIIEKKNKKIKELEKQLEDMKKRVE